MSGPVCPTCGQHVDQELERLEERVRKTAALEQSRHPDSDPGSWWAAFQAWDRALTKRDALLAKRMNTAAKHSPEKN